MTFALRQRGRIIRVLGDVTFDDAHAAAVRASAGGPVTIMETWTGSAWVPVADVDQAPSPTTTNRRGPP